MASPPAGKPRTVHTEPDFACDVMLPITKPYPRPFVLAELTEPFLCMLRTEPGFPRPALLDLAGMAVVTVANPPWGSGGLDQGLSAQPSIPESAESLRHQSVRPGSMWLREYVLVLETVSWVSYQQAVGRNAAPMVHQECLPTN